MKQVKYIVYRYLSEADYFNIYKPTGTETGGGGQTYIDFPVNLVNAEEWDLFFDGLPDVVIEGVAQGNRWTFPVWSIGIGRQQTIWIYQRRAASISIAAQNINTRGANRVYAWHPDYGFPIPIDANDRHQLPDGLVIFFARTKNEVWVGWFNKNEDRIYRDDNAKTTIMKMISERNVEGNASFINLLDKKIFLDEKDRKKPFSTSVKRKKQDETKIIEDLFKEDDEYEGDVEDNVKETIVKIRKRNTKAVKLLKALYEHECQITEGKYIFKKKDGTNYTEAHHLIPLGEGGADNPLNIIIISPLIHRMLHYAKVSDLDLSEIQGDKSGNYFLFIQINNVDYKIIWHPKHMKKIKEIPIN